MTHATVKKNCQIAVCLIPALSAATRPATPPAAITAAISTASSVTVGAATPVVGTGTGLIDDNGSLFQCFTVETRDGSFRFRL